MDTYESLVEIIAVEGVAKTARLLAAYLEKEVELEESEGPWATEVLDIARALHGIGGRLHNAQALLVAPTRVGVRTYKVNYRGDAKVEHVGVPSDDPNPIATVLARLDATQRDVDSIELLGDTEGL